MSLQQSMSQLQCCSKCLVSTDLHFQRFRRDTGSPGIRPGCFTLFGPPSSIAVCLLKLPTGEYVSPQYGGSWTLESSSLSHHPTAIIALNRTIRDGVSYVNCLTPIPEEWLIERDWYIVNHWEDQFCRDVYQELCVFAEMQHLRATALISPGSSGQHRQHTSGTTIGEGDNCEDARPMCLEICAQAR